MTGPIESPVGREAVETATEYRLSWEMVPSSFAAATEARYGRDCWPVLDWSSFEWHEVSKITTDPWSQWNTLGKWAESREQPIRNVRLERRVVPVPDEGWEVV